MWIHEIFINKDWKHLIEEFELSMEQQEAKTLKERRIEVVKLARAMFHSPSMSFKK